jgi:hypothetical protein
MQSRDWFLTTIVMTLGSGSAVMGVNIAVDPYGLYHQPKGSRLIVYGDERVAKYLLNIRYVPANFDAVLIGPSVSANWDMNAIEKLHVYNDSLNGGNIVEGKSLMESAMARSGISMVFLLVHPALTFSHEYETVTLTPELKFSSLGSRSLLEAYKQMLNIRLHRSRQIFDYAGTEDFGTIPTTMNADMKRLWRAGDNFEIDPIALVAYRDTVAELHARHVQIVFIVPPTFENLLQGKRQAFDNYIRLIQDMATAEDKWVDFTSEGYADLRRNRLNFPDGVHLVPQAARRVVSYLNTKVNDWIAQKRLAAAH